MIHEFKSPIEVSTRFGAGLLLYVQSGGTWSNDIFAVVLEDGGKIMHFTSDQIRVWSNGTWNIKKDVDFQSGNL